MNDFDNDHYLYTNKIKQLSFVEPDVKPVAVIEHTGIWQYHIFMLRLIDNAFITVLRYYHGIEI